VQVLVLNSGSSSIKYRLFDPDLEVLASGLIERIGEPTGRASHRVSVNGDVQEHVEEGPIPDHAAGFAGLIAALEAAGLGSDLGAIGHRVVHGGSEFVAPTVIDATVIERIRAQIPLAPLHNPANLVGIEVAEQLRPDLPQVAVFDTAFHATLPPHAYRYALPGGGVRGTRCAPLRVPRDLARVRLPTRRRAPRTPAGRPGHGHPPPRQRRLGRRDPGRGVHRHLDGPLAPGGAGDGHPVRGPRPRDRLPPRPSGRDEPGRGRHAVEQAQRTRRAVRRQRPAGDRGRASQGDEAAALAVDVYAYRIRKYLGAYTAALGGLDAIVFTAGVGENQASIRAEVCDGLQVLGVELDAERNRSADVRGASDGVVAVQADDSRVAVLVVATDEEREIADQTRAAVS
jgi:acetate kinase